MNRHRDRKGKTDQPANGKVLIWDLPVRIFHWALSMLVVFSWFTMEVSFNPDLHMLSGYTILTLLLFRIAWGFLGPEYARFRNLFYPPRTILAYARTVFTRQARGYAGHNPLGGLSVAVMLLLLLVQAVTGLFVFDEADFVWGPLSGKVSEELSATLTEIHHTNFNILLAFITLHIAAVLHYRFYKKERLITAMITGEKPDAAGTRRPIPGSRIPLALSLLAIAAALVYGIVRYGQ